MSKQIQREKTASRVRKSSVGSNAPRIDTVDKVRGKAEYGSDLENEEMLHAAILYSTQRHARLDAIDTTAAENIPGVECVIPRTDLSGYFDDKVRHYGDVIAAVAAENPETADRAVKVIDYELHSLDGVYDAREAVLAESPTVQENNVDHGQHGQHALDIERDEYVKNIDDYHRFTEGDIEEGFSEADFVLEEEYASPRVEHCNLDTHCTIAEWQGDTLVLTETLASHGRGRNEIAKFMGLNREQVKIQEPPTASSSFGGRSLPKRSVEPVAGSLAIETSRPVRLQFNREQEFVSSSTRHRTYYTIKTGVTDTGEITAMQIDVTTDTGPYPNGVGHVVLSNSRDRPLDLYRIKNYSYEGVSAFTNNVPAGEYRGIGSTQLMMTLESHLDELTRQAGINPVEFRQKNFLKEGDERAYTSGPLQSCGVQDCLDEGLERMNDLKQGTTSDPDTVCGWGFAAGAHPTTSGATKEDSSEAVLTFKSDGSIIASTGAVDQGQGVDTVIAQIVSQEVGVPTSKIAVDPFATTDQFDDHLGSIAARSTYIIGAAVRDAAMNLAEVLRERAARILDTNLDSISFENEKATGPSGRSIVLKELLSPTDNHELEVYGEAASDETPISYGVHFAEVEVDKETGAMNLLTYVAAQDVGYAINPMMVEGQLEGAIQHGTELALFSELQLDQGIPKNANLADYPVISPLEMPDKIDCVIIESNEESGPYGAKGLGTPSMPPVAPAILNAVRDATGVRFHDPPVSDEKVWQAQGEGL